VVARNYLGKKQERAVGFNLYGPGVSLTIMRSVGSSVASVRGLSGQIRRHESAKSEHGQRTLARVRAGEAMRASQGVDSVVHEGEALPVGELSVRSPDGTGCGGQSHSVLTTWASIRRPTPPSSSRSGRWAARVRGFVTAD
jgi:hypothetical protein